MITYYASANKSEDAKSSDYRLFVPALIKIMLFIRVGPPLHYRGLKKLNLIITHVHYSTDIPSPTLRCYSVPLHHCLMYGMVRR